MMTEEKIMNNKEIHPIVIWSNAGNKKDDILNDLLHQDNIKVIECYDIEWKPENMASNYARLYSASINNGLNRISSRGDGNVFVITIMDENPDYKFVETYSGHEFLNYNIYKLKSKYREWTGGGYKIHASNNLKEAKRNLVLLLGINYEDYFKKVSELTEYNHEVKHIQRDISGCNGWESLEEMFYTLNEISNYVILRNNEILPNDFQSDLHGDIDILTDDMNILVSVLNAVEYKTKRCVKHYVNVNGQKVKLDIRELGDDYYCHDFEKDMLKTRVLNKNNIYVPNDEYYFYSLIYHALIQKKKISPDYYDKLYSLFLNIKADKTFNLEQYSSPIDLYFYMLREFMKNKNYFFVQPKDKVVVYNKKILDLNDDIEWLSNYYQIKDIKTCNIQRAIGKSVLYFEGYLNNEHVFVKTKCLKNAPKYEFKILQTLYDTNPENFVKPLCFRSEFNIQNLITQYVSGYNLEELYTKNLVTPEIKNVLLKDLEQIAHCLQNCNIIHGNIEPANLIYSDDGHFKLVDFKCATNLNSKKKNPFIEKHFKSMKINMDFAYKENEFDNFYSISKILELFGLKSQYIDENIGKNTIVIGDKKNTLDSVYKNIFSISNEYSKDRSRKYKVWKIAGIKIKYKVKQPVC